MLELIGAMLTGNEDLVDVYLMSGGEGIRLVIENNDESAIADFVGYEARELVEVLNRALDKLEKMQ